MPGFVDAHTHVVFGGTRVEEYAARVAGAEPPAGAAVGIGGTTAATRRCSVADSPHGAARVEECPLWDRPLRQGGYGLQAPPDACSRPAVSLAGPGLPGSCRPIWGRTHSPPASTPTGTSRRW
jgi:hypothetical protein